MTENGVTGFDTAQALRQRLADRTAVWEFLRLFNAAWGLSGDPVAADLEQIYAALPTDRWSC